MDREKVIKGWETVLSRDPLDAPWDLIDETLALLKEQKEVVLCKDCKHQHEYRTGSCPYYTTYGSVPPDDWHCGDGEKAEIIHDYMVQIANNQLAEVEK